MRRVVYAVLYWLPAVLLILVMLAGMTLTWSTFAHEAVVFRTHR